MSFLFPSFWNANTQQQQQPMETVAEAGAMQPPLTRTLSAGSSSHDDEFVYVDTPCAPDESNRSGTASAEDSITASPTPSTSRMCRPYGYAHRPPARIVATNMAPAAAAAAAATPTSSPLKRSFAECVAASPAPSSSKKNIVAYAQDASLSVADSMRERIAQLEVAAALTSPPLDGEDLILIRNLQSTSPPLRPVSLSQPLDPEAHGLFLDAQEPNSKRSKREPLKLMSANKLSHGQSKGKSKASKAAFEREMRRARGDKQAC